MEEAPENGKESPHSVHANGLIDFINSVERTLFHNNCNNKIIVIMYSYLSVSTTKGHFLDHIQLGVNPVHIMRQHIDS